MKMRFTSVAFANPTNDKVLNIASQMLRDLNIKWYEFIFSF
jgi:hypothetical protein